MEQLEKLRADFEAHRDSTNNSIDLIINESLPNKADKSDLLDLEGRIMEKLRDMIQQILS